MSIPVIILARAGSKGVPGKNHAMVGGRACIEWTIDAAKAAQSVTHIGVSTDSPEVAAVAAKAGCTVITRPSDLASDTATVDAAARHAVQNWTLTPAATHVVVLYANVPIRPAGLIDRAVELLRSSGCDSVQSYAPVGKYHPWWTARLDASGQVRAWEGEVLNHNIFRRQDLPPAYIPDGGIIAVSRRALMLEIPGVPAGPHAFFGLDRRGVINPEGSVVDIDSPVDLVVADTLLRRAAGA